MLYELRQNNVSMMIHADSPEQAIAEFRKHYEFSPSSTIDLPPQDAKLSCEERVLLLKVRLLNNELHYETSFESDTWFHHSCVELSDQAAIDTAIAQFNQLIVISCVAPSSYQVEAIAA